MTPPSSSAETSTLELQAPATASPATRGRNPLGLLLLAVWVVAAGGALGYGWDYYMTPVTERPFAALHPLLAPSGRIGHSLGIAGSLMMIVGVSMYSLRKRVTWLSSAGRLSRWLQVHIFLCTLGPFLVLLHTSFRIGGIVSIAFWSMVAVVLSGLFGRYVYVRIPKTIHGQFRTLQSIEAQRTEMANAIAARASVPAAEVEALLRPVDAKAPRGLAGAIASAIRFDFSRRSRTARMRRALERWKLPAPLRGRVLDLLEKEAELEQQVRLLQPFQRLFRYWHVFHLPLAIVMFLILIVHVVVAAMFGYAWPH
jgi:hypothetical protein